MLTKWIIERKRDGVELKPEEIEALIQGYTIGEVPDYQMAAFAMAVYFRGMTPAETAALTKAMMHSGEVLSFDDEPRPSADKHSTGGVGDKISLILAPLAAAAGLAVPMISGRGLGVTGGTLDKLESIPGFNVQLRVADFKRIVREVGCCMIGQTATLAPADRKLYALRDVTGTVPSIPLITASIMSKKLAEGAATLVFDVKCGRGAFMRTLEDARGLAASLIRTGAALDRRMAALITDMDRPLGASIGNALEVREAIEVLRGSGPQVVRDLTIELVAHMAVLSDVQPTLVHARGTLARLLDKGQALDRFARMITAQGGDARCFSAQVSEIVDAGKEFAHHDHPVVPALRRQPDPALIEPQSPCKKEEQKLGPQHPPQGTTESLPKGGRVKRQAKEAHEKDIPGQLPFGEKLPGRKGKFSLPDEPAAGGEGLRSVQR